MSNYPEHQGQFNLCQPTSPWPVRTQASPITPLPLLSLYIWWRGFTAAKAGSWRQAFRTNEEGLDIMCIIARVWLKFLRPSGSIEAPRVSLKYLFNPLPLSHSYSVICFVLNPPSLHPFHTSAIQSSLLHHFSTIQYDNPQVPHLLFPLPTPDPHHHLHPNSHSRLSHSQNPHRKCASLHE